MSENIRNIVFILTDQQRHDTIGALGSPYMRTPNLDRLVDEGVAFRNAFACGATCVPSRAAIYTGMFAHNTGCYGFDAWSHHRSWVHELREAGWHTAAIGKVHHSPPDSPSAFIDRIYAENFPEMENWSDDYANYLKSAGYESPCKLITQDGRWLKKCAADPFPLPEEYHVDQFVGRMATRWIHDHNLDEPFFLHIGFVGPHDPFDPPERFLEMYENVDVPMPIKGVNELDRRLPHYRRHMESLAQDPCWEEGPSHGVWAANPGDATDSDLKRMRKHYFAKITQIDEQIGRVLKALEERGLLESTLIVFSSDHGENLGDHGLLYKWLMTEEVVRIPFVVRLPGRARAGVRDDELFSHIDLGPTFLDAVRVDIPDRLDGVSQLRRILCGDSSTVPEAVYCEDNYLVMRRTRNRKLIYYTGQRYGEFYDLEADPREVDNLYENHNHKGEITQMKAALFDWMAASRYHGSLIHIDKSCGSRSIWPANHPEDPYVLHPGMKRSKGRMPQG